MRHAFAFLLALSLLPFTARAQANVVVVDRDALVKNLRAFHGQLMAMREMTANLGPREPMARNNPRAQAAAQLQYQIQGLAEQMKALERDIRGLAPASASCAGQAPRFATVAPSPPPSPSVIVAQPPPPVAVAPPPPPAPVYPAPAPYYPVIDEDTLAGLLDAIAGQSFAEDRIRVLRDTASNSWFRVAQVERVLPLYTFSAERLRALEIVAPRLVDRQNAFRIYNLFTFSADKERVHQILGR